jgi:SAM-dependent methyltransferase
VSGAGCRFCGAPLGRVFCDLGMSPLSNNYLDPGFAASDEPRYPLCAYVCDRCLLVQLESFETPQQIFSDYAYFSSYSDSWVAHARDYAAAACARLALGPGSTVIEVASNDGYLLQHFRERSIPVLGIEPAANVAAEAERRGIPTLVEFFGCAVAERLRREGRRADLLVGNNVLAHVPDLNDFVEGLARLVADDGVITMEFPHLLRLMLENQFDTIYHEHFSYFSLLTAEKVFAAHGLTLFDVERIPTHGGSLRIYACRAQSGRATPSPRLDALRAEEQAAGLGRVEGYAAFAGQVREARRGLLELLGGLKRAGKRIAGYGAPAKGNTLLNYCGIGTETIDYTVDRSPHKQGKLLPGSHIPIFAPEKVAQTKPDFLLILPWNIKDEVMQQMAHIRAWGGKFLLPIPRPTILE